MLHHKNFAQNKPVIEKKFLSRQEQTVNTIDSVQYSAKKDTTNTKPKKKSNSIIDAQIIYSAQDSIVLSRDSKKVYLYNNAKVEYGDVVLEAYFIEYDQENNYVYAEGYTDTLGHIDGKPKFKEKGEEFIARTIKYNFKTKKGYIEDVFTEEEEGFLHSEQTKKLEDNSFLLKKGKYTTCSNEDHPHFYLSMTKAKVIPGEKIVSGPAYLVMADVPIPLGVPFGYFPSQREYSSGVIIPTYGESTNRGFYLQHGGYYFGISDKMDLAITGDIYSKGSWGTDALFHYKKRYKFSSSFDFSYAEFKRGEEGQEDYSNEKNMRIRWTHTQDAKANPNSNFSANVDYSTLEYDNYNSRSIEQRAQNQKQSNIAYSKTWPGSPFRLNMNLRHSQNSNTKDVNLTVPAITFNMNRQNPFRRKNSTGDTKWYEDIEVQYSSEMKNTISTKDSLLFNDTKWSDFDKGFKHNIPISTNIKILKYFNLTPKVEYTGILYPNYVKYSADTIRNAETNKMEVETSVDTINEVRYAQLIEPSISLSVNPNFYGMYQMKNPNSKVVAVRHVVTPSVGIRYVPDLGKMVEGYYSTYYNDTLLQNEVEYSKFKNGVYQFPAAPGESGSVSFGLKNNLEMKVRSDKDTSGTGMKKIKLLESLNFTTSYTLFIEEFNWAPISIRGRTSLFNQKLSVNFGGSLNMYALDENGTKINRMHWFNTDETAFLKKIGRLERFDFSLSFKFNKQSSSGNSESANQRGNLDRGYSQNPVEQEMLDYQEQIMTYVDFDVPWSLNVDYKYVYSKTGLEETKNITQTVGLNGDLSLTKNWKISFRANFDIEEKELSNASVNIHRELHCWEMRFTWIPVGYMQSYSFQINVKGSTLRDFLKYDKKKRWQDNL